MESKIGTILIRGVLILLENAIFHYTRFLPSGRETSR